MAGKFLQLMLTPEVLSAQERAYGRARPAAPAPERDPLTADEAAFIGQRDSFYLATVNRDGWPYVQHRGGPVGFLKVLGPSQLGFADLPGNRQLLSVGHTMANDCVSLFLMDYVQRERLKILGHARVVEAGEQPELRTHFATPGTPPPERYFLIDVVSFDWNCPKYITQRYPAADVRAALEPLQKRIAELERQAVS